MSCTTSSKFSPDASDHIHRNPVEEGLVEEPHHYLYSSARDETGLPGLLKLGTIRGEVIMDRPAAFERT